MKPQHFAALVGTLVVMALILLLAGRPAPGEDLAATTPPRTVTVLGEGEKRAKPDQVALTFGVTAWTQGASAAGAEALTLASVSRLTETIQRTGVAAEAISTTVPVVAPLTRQDYAGRTYLTGYQSTSHVMVTVTNLTRADAIVAAGLANGATSLDSAVYGLQNLEEIRRQATQAAVENARERAGAILIGQDLSVGELLSVEVISEDVPSAQTGSPGAVIVRVKVKATYGF